MPVLPALSNGYDTDAVRGYVERIQNLHGRLGSLRGGYMRDCREVREDIANVIEEAKTEHGLPKKELRLLVKKLELQAKADAVGEDLDTDQASNFVRLEEALGDFQWTPLGEAAMAAAEAAKPAATSVKAKGKSKKAADDELAGQTDIEDAATAEAGGEPWPDDEDVDRFVGSTHAERAASAQRG